jgi:DNA-binding MarR family transcriptional regulator
MKKYFELIDKMHLINNELELNSYEIYLLDLTARAHFSKQPICVGDLIYKKKNASQATLHAALKRLMVKKLLATKIHENDGRIKEVGLTKIAIIRYKRLRRAMVFI